MDVVLQSEAAECGIACLAMIASHHGNAIGLREIRRRHSFSLKGTSLPQLIAVAGKLGLQSRALRLELDELDQLKLPCIAHWDLNHFVVVRKVERNTVTVVDPALGTRKLAMSEFSKHFTGVSLELQPGGDFRRIRRPEPTPLPWLTGRIRGLGRSLALLIVLSLSLQIFVLSAPFFMQWVVDQALVASDHNLLSVLAAGFGLALLIQVGIGQIRGRSVIYLSSRLGSQWSANVFSHLIKLRLDFFEKRHLGDIVSRMGSVQAIQRIITTSFVEAIIDGMMAIATVMMMILYSWKLAMISLASISVYAVARMLSFNALKLGTEQQLIASARQQSHLLESIRGIQSIKVAGRESTRRSRYLNLINDTVNQDVKLSTFALTFNGSGQLIFGIERIVVIWIGATLAMQSVFSVGMLIAYLAYKEQFSQRVGSLVDKWIEFRMLRLHGERLSEIVLAETEPEPTSRGRRLDPSAPLRIDVKDLGFRYSESEQWVIRNCSFSIGEGESVAIVGGSGCGKTTLLKILLGLLQPNEGEVVVGGVPLRNLASDDYKRLVGAVMQDDQLFAGTIRENISFEDEIADDSWIQEAAKLAAVHDDIMAMPMAYESLIGDMGTSLSGGQKQRIVLARALYRKPGILFLDEATSHLDVENERAVSEAINSMDLTRVIIAHRPETIASADRVILLRDGKVINELATQQHSAFAQEVLS
ncbi:peptidase domain-containing ABC transporter [Stenotrophomonas sp. ASS1]|uniref:peptidase domain-containing ABC transporter n=1 Tax=Stenotrophomonas sp. ASS1 TaxID=2282124 RepID=UPI00104B76AD|nr:peptidase domain-containing ABC transporter [Stenotrophomonas sp. ASS1]QBL42226.1 peptidase domain-containing ABC transporter [Stenotrophomonas sp. ASS1]